ncbi:tetratricopeptide repeat protein [Aquimarina aggregata]|uniref:tetratricopeptide repeat protein n=2 Tax=Aquimarina aggregata TaxID=1642818 RepID=UPI0024925514|nr:tetratricopeptide repeat protein [Aquimarina aggregata]
MKQILFSIFLVSHSILFPQSEIDSLLNSLSTMKEDTTKVNKYLTLWEKYKRIDQNSALNFAIEAEKLSKKLKFKDGLGEAKYRRGVILRDKGLNVESQKYLEEALSIFSELDDLRTIGFVKIDLGKLKQNQSKHKEALSLYLEVLPIAKKNKDKNTEARIYNYIAAIYATQKQYVEGIKNYEHALKLVREINHLPGISACLLNLGTVYATILENDKALPYFKESLEIKESIGDKLGASRIWYKLAMIYLEKKQYNLAENNIKKAYDLVIAVDHPNHFFDVQYGMALIFLEKGEHNRSIDIAKKILSNAKASKYTTLSIRVHRLLHKAYNQKKEYKKAYNYALKVIAISDSLYNQNILSVTNDMEAKYQNEQKATEIALLASENKSKTITLAKQKNERNAIIAFSIIILLLAMLLFSQYRLKQKSNDKLKELDRLKSNFFANISHEFRTPLTLIKGPIEKLEKDPNTPLSIESVKMIKRNSNRLLNLVNQLLELSKLDAGSLKLELKEGNIYKCLRVAATSFDSHAEQRNIYFKISIPDTVLWALFDRDKLEKIIYNLLSNAFKFSEDSSVIICKVDCIDTSLRIEVIDSGCGIAKENIPFIFDRFYQVDSSTTKEREGSGIGLSLSKDLVTLMGGTILCTSEINQGSCFTVTIPIHEIKVKTKIDVTSSNEMIITNTKIETFEFHKHDSRDIPTILVIEDNLDMNEFITQELIKKYKIVQATNGKDGWQKALSNPPDLIITDLMMPGIDGIELCAKVKTEIHTSHIPVIMLTAKAGLDNKIEGLETGADDYLTKPFDVHELQTRVDNLIKQRQKLRHLFRNTTTQIDPKKITVTSLDQKFLEEVLSLFEANFSDPSFGVPEMQKALGMSKTQLHSKLKALTNESPGQLLRNFRLKIAEQLLSQKEDNITQIAYKVGFNNLSYFAKCFKERYAVVPSAYYIHKTK